MLAIVGALLEPAGYAGAGAALVGCATVAPASPEACVLESLQCATSQWPKCGPIPGEGALPSEILRYSLCKFNAAIDCYKQVTGPDEPCEQIEAK